MMKNLLMGRKRTRELGSQEVEITELKKEQLLAMKINELNDEARDNGTLLELPLDNIQADPQQPRKTFHNIELLANSIKEQGIIQPIIVREKSRPVLVDDIASTAESKPEYLIIAGERRFLAAKSIHLNSIPCIVRQEDDVNTLLIQLLENSQREQVAPLEEAIAIEKLIKEKKLSKREVAEQIGQTSAWISMRLGLLGASDKIKQLIEDRKIEDFRTIHELRKLEDQDVKAADKIISQINKNQLIGSYRKQITQARSDIKKRTNNLSTHNLVNNLEYNTKSNTLTVYKADGTEHLYKVKKDLLLNLLNKIK